MKKKVYRSDERTNENGRTNERTNERTDERSNEQTKERTDGRTRKVFDAYIKKDTCTRLVSRRFTSDRRHVCLPYLIVNVLLCCWSVKRRAVNIATLIVIAICPEKGY